MQLVAYGAQDIYLTGNPQITFFKVVYRRHTNFSMETIEQTINGSPGPSATSSVTISRNGDLVHKIYVTSTLAGSHGGDQLVDEVELEIGGQLIDRQYSEWMQVWNELSVPESKCKGLKSMLACYGSVGRSAEELNIIQVPLLFWFCRNPGLALPLIALQYHEVQLKIKWGKASNGADSAACGVNCEYIFLDTDERRRFAQVSHEYLIEQIQREEMSASNSHKLTFNHPVKEIIWTTDDNTYKKAKLTLNGHDRLALQPREYYQLRQPYDYHTAVPRQNLQHNAQLSGGFSLGSPLINPTLTASNAIVGSANEIHYLGSSSASGIMEFHTNNWTEIDNAIEVGDEIILKILSLGENSIIYRPVTFANAVTNKISEARQKAIDFSFKVTNKDSQHRELTTTQITSISFEIDINSQSSTDISPLIISNLTSGTSPATVSLTKKVINNDVSRTSNMKRKINVYSFALKPEEHQPSGSCNFSRIDSAYLEFSASSAANVYAVNYNVLRIMSGMGGLAYSN